MYIYRNLCRKYANICMYICMTYVWENMIKYKYACDDTCIYIYVCKYDNIYIYICMMCISIYDMKIWWWFSIYTYDNTYTYMYVESIIIRIFTYGNIYMYIYMGIYVENQIIFV